MALSIEPSNLDLPVRATDDGSGAIGQRRDRAKEQVEKRAKFRKRFNFLFPVALVGVTSLTILFSPISAWLIVLVVVVATLFIVVPVRPALLITFFLAMAVDNPNGIPAGGNWSNPWLFIGAALYRNLKPLPVCLLDLLAFSCLLRGFFHHRTESKARIQRERVFSRVVAIGLIAIAITMVWGLFKGGDLRQAVYQSRTVFYMPAFGIAIATIGDITFLRRLKTCLLVAAMIKALTGLYPYFYVVSKNPKQPMEYVTVHADSLLYCMAFAAVIAAWVANLDKRLRRFHTIGMIGAVVGLYTNQRRIAFVGLAFALMLMYLDAPLVRRSQINRFLSKYIPVFVIYLAVAFTGVSQNVIFRPALSLRSVVIQKDRSSETRDIENYNLWATYRPNPVLGLGFGHKYTELVAADYIGDVFPQYRYLPHNSFLGLFAFGGFVGALGFYSIFPTSLYLALRAAKRQVSPERWTYAMIGAGGIAATLVQGFGDVGFFDPTVGLYGGISIGICGALYCANDATSKAPVATPDARTAVKLTT
jgi:O-Antigen ligase